MMKTPVSRRGILMSTLFGAGYVGLRALATGIPAAVLMQGRKAFADGAVPTCGNMAKAQYVIMSTSGQGDPINANVPGMYLDSKISHPPAGLGVDKTALKLGSTSTFAAAPWAALPQAVLDRSTFWHIMTNTPIHPKEPDVLKLMGTIAAGEMMPSLLAQQLQPCMGTIQAQPITLGASTPSEGLSFNGQALPIIPPLALKATLTSPAGGLANLQGLRDQTLNQLSDLYRGGANKAQKAYLDSLITSQSQVRNINQDLLSSLSMIKDNSVDAQITAAIALIRMNVTPVVMIHIPFGGDNHNDTGLAKEAAQTITGVGSIASLMSQLGSAQLSEKVSFLSLNVFGRTVGPGNTDGRQHNPDHQVSLAIGAPFKGGILGGVAPKDGDYGAMAFDSNTGAVSDSGDVAAGDSLASYGKTALAAFGVPSATIDAAIGMGKVVPAALA